MDVLAKDSRGLWAKASAKADAQWGAVRNSSDVESRREKLEAKVMVAASPLANGWVREGKVAGCWVCGPGQGQGFTTPPTFFGGGGGCR